MRKDRVSGKTATLGYRKRNDKILILIYLRQGNHYLKPSTIGLDMFHTALERCKITSLRSKRLRFKRICRYQAYLDWYIDTDIVRLLVFQLQ